MQTEQTVLRRGMVLWRNEKDGADGIGFIVLYYSYYEHERIRARNAIKLRISFQPVKKSVLS